MPDILKPDICVIGGGAGGLSVAAGAAAFGVSVVLVERAAMGGECLNTGCVPSKSLLAAGRRAELIRKAGDFGLSGAEPKVTFRRVHDHVQQVIAGIAPTDSAERFRAMGVNVIEGEARFSDRRTLAVGDARIRARRFVVATGSDPAIPPIAGLSEVPYHTNETIFSLTRRPAHLAILGAGPVGIELAQAFARLGSEVTVIEAAEPLGSSDAELAGIVLDSLARDGVAVHSGTSVSRVEATRRGVRLILGGGDGAPVTLEATDLLVATGRKPRVRDFGLEVAGIRHDAGGIKVNARMRTSNRRVYALGDVVGAPASTHIATYQAGIVVRNVLFRLRSRVDYHHIPHVIYADPELAQVGLTEEQARARHRGLRILRWPYAENDRARTEHDTTGHIKVITTRRGRILGVGIVGTEAGELIQIWSLAIAQELTIRDMVGLVPPYPTRGEISRRAAIEFYRPSLTRPMVRRIIAFLRLFG